MVPVWHGPAPVVVGHRGAPCLARENTPASFAAALAAGASWVELDVRRSVDGVLVVHHDPVTADGRPLVARGADALRQLGVWALDEVLRRLPPAAGVDVEVKNTPGEPDHDETDAVVAALPSALGDDRDGRPLLVSSFNPRTLAAARERLPDVPTGLLHTGLQGVDAAAALALDLRAQAVCAPRDAPGLDAAGVARVHARGLQVMVWTVDDPRRARRLAAAGVDALCTNDPGRVTAALG
ncbi:glycerophosphodiester phosphodiesterase [soil metagenome]